LIGIPGLTSGYSCALILPVQYMGSENLLGKTRYAASSTGIADAADNSRIRLAFCLSDSSFEILRSEQRNPFSIRAVSKGLVEVDDPLSRFFPGPGIHGPVFQAGVYGESEHASWLDALEDASFGWACSHGN